ncbi:MAG: tetratricopeptide repeat protein, partial [Bryobacteraceae bacterium]
MPLLLAGRRVFDSTLPPALKAVGLLCFLHLFQLGAIPRPSDTQGLTNRHTLVVEANKLSDAHEFVDALRLYGRAAQLAREAHDPSLEAMADFSSGACLIHLFRYRQAISWLNTAREIALRIDNKSIAGGADLNTTTVYLQLGEFLLAQKTAQEATRLLEDSPRKDAYAMALMNLARVEAERDDLDRARSFYNQAISVAEANNLFPKEASAWSHLGQSLLVKDELAESRRAFTEAYRLYLMQHNEAELAVVRADLALLDYKEGRYNEALVKLNAALASPPSALASIPPYFLLHLHGQIYAALHRDPEALAYFQKAVDAADEWRGNALPGDLFSVSTVAYLHDV